MKPLIAYLIAFFIVGVPAVTYAQPKPTTAAPVGTFTVGDGTVVGTVKEGDQAKNLLVLPPWTMRKCPKDFFATYDQTGAKQLKLRDNDCHLWNVKQTELTSQVGVQTIVIEKLKQINTSHEEEHKLDEKRIQDLVKQVKTEIEEKNKYKYQPNYNWLWISIGAAVALAGVAFGAGVWLAKKE